MPEKPMVTISIKGAMENDDVYDRINNLPAGVGYSAQVTAPVAGYRTFHLSARGLTVDEARSVLDLFEEAR